MARLCPRGHIVTTAARCPICEKARNARRGSRQQRGYDIHHDRARRELARTLPAPCGYGCGTLMTAGSRWVAAHVQDGNPEAGYIVACQSCNLKARNKGQQAYDAREGRGHV